MSKVFNKYSMRRESLISPWGVGAIVPFPHDESLMVAGIDYWFDKEHSYEDFLIADERLTKRLGGKQFVHAKLYVSNNKKRTAKAVLTDKLKPVAGNYYTLDMYVPLRVSTRITSPAFINCGTWIT